MKCGIVKFGNSNSRWFPTKIPCEGPEVCHHFTINLLPVDALQYVRSEFYRERSQLAGGEEENDAPALFGIREGRIAWANRRKDPLLLFAALHRQLGYPAVPKPSQEIAEERLLAVLARRVEQLEARLKLVEEEQRGGIDLNRFYEANRPADSPGPRRGLITCGIRFFAVQCGYVPW